MLEINKLIQELENILISLTENIEQDNPSDEDNRLYYSQFCEQTQNILSALTEEPDDSKISAAINKLFALHSELGDLYKKGILAATCYEFSLNLYKQYPNNITIQTASRVYCNFANTYLFMLESNIINDEKMSSQPIDLSNLKSSLNDIADSSIRQLMALRQKESPNPYAVRKLTSLLIRTHQCTQKISKEIFDGENDTRLKLHWILAYILDENQLLSFSLEPRETPITSLDDLFITLEPPLSEAQQQAISNLSVDDVDIQEILNDTVINMQAFTENDRENVLGLYPHQSHAIQNLQDHLQQGNNTAYFVSATGTGKTRMFNSMILHSGANALVIVPSRALVSQTQARLERLIDILEINKSVGTFCDGKKIVGDITVTTYGAIMIQMLRPPFDRELPLDQFNMVIIDEAHMALTGRSKLIIDELRQSKIVLACTATDEYNIKRPKDSLYSLEEMFGADNCIFRYPVDKAIEEDRLCPIHVCYVTTDTSLRQLRSRSKKSGIVEELSEKVVAKKINLENSTKSWQKYIKIAYIQIPKNRFLANKLLCSVQELSIPEALLKHSMRFLPIILTSLIIILRLRPPYPGNSTVRNKPHCYKSIAMEKLPFYVVQIY